MAMTDQEIKEKAINDVATAYGIDPEYLRRLLEDVANKMPPYNVVLSPPAFKPTLDEKKLRAILEQSEIHSRFSMHDFLEQRILQMRFIQDSNGDMMRKPLDDFNQNNKKI